ncbi:BTAD domain-containing putative transcriptional regulator [Nonomuraea sp. NPDC050556]|uniref:AfsR/SARP family transcriptional regulator n=1 Tax=Nonomuraea sp. NPDC050556 TaxID=3364369 RepID=UPI0037A64FCA
MDKAWFGLLGPLEVRIGDRPVRLSGSRQERVLAALLLDARRVVTVDRLVDVVWEEPPATARRQVQDLVTRLRRTLQAEGASPELITTRRAGYVLTPEPGGLDSEQFDALVAEGRLTSAAPLLRGALALWRGEPLAGLRGQAFESAAATLQERRLAVLEDCLALDLEQGRHREVIDEATALLERHPLRETLAGVLMRALAGVGRLSAALEAYRAVERRLADELGASPGAGLRAVHDTLRRHDPRPPALLPADPRGFAGREKELARLDELGPIVVISGTAGVGKSALAVHWGHRARSRFPDGQLHVNLRGFEPSGPAAVHPYEALRRFLSALGQIPPASMEEQLSLYRAVLAERRVLVVLDNARDADQVRPLLPGTPGCIVVVTSRDRLSGLVAVEGADPLPLDLLPHDQARSLLERRVGPGRMNAEPAAVAEIIDGCARLPLALAIVAARAAAHPSFPLSALAAELRTGHRLDVLDGGEVALQLRAVFACSYRLLSAPAASLFRLMSLHPGTDLAAPAAASLLGVPLGRARALLAELTRAHLVSEAAPGRYGYHDLLRAYAGELTEPQEAEVAARRLLDHYVHTAQAAAAVLSPHRDPVVSAPPTPGTALVTFGGPEEALAWFASEHLAGFDSWELAWAQFDYLDRQGRWQELLQAQERALVTAEGSSSGTAHTHRNLGWVLTRLGRTEDAHLHLKRALELFEHLADVTNRAHTHGTLCGLLERQGRYGEAAGHARRALRLYGTAGHSTGQARAANAVGWLNALMGNQGVALAYCTLALSLHDHTGDRHGLAITWDSLGYAYRRLDDFPQAIACFVAALDLFRSVGDRRNEADTLVRLGDAELAAGDAEAARRSREAAEQLFTALARDNPARAPA